MSKIQAERKANFYNAFVRHEKLSYAPIQMSESKWAVGQYFNGEQVAIL